MIEKENWTDLEYGYDYSPSDILWSYDRDAGELTIYGELRGEDVKITILATAEEWGHVAELFEDGDCDAVDEWHMAHIVSVEVDRMARWDTDAGCDVLCDLHEARDLLAEALRKSREGVLPSSGRISNAMHEAEEAIDVLTAALRRAGVLE